MPFGESGTSCRYVFYYCFAISVPSLRRISPRAREGTPRISIERVWYRAVFGIERFVPLLSESVPTSGFAPRGCPSELCAFLGGETTGSSLRVFERILLLFRGNT